MRCAGTLIASVCQSRQLALLGDAGDALDERAGEWTVEDGVGEAGREGAVAG